MAGAGPVLLVGVSETYFFFIPVSQIPNRILAREGVDSVSNQRDLEIMLDAIFLGLGLGGFVLLGLYAATARYI